VEQLLKKNDHLEDQASGSSNVQTLGHATSAQKVLVGANNSSVQVFKLSIVNHDQKTGSVYRVLNDLVSAAEIK
jgi:hypothetical protein